MVFHIGTRANPLILPSRPRGIRAQELPPFDTALRARQQESGASGDSWGTGGDSSVSSDGGVRNGPKDIENSGAGAGGATDVPDEVEQPVCHRYCEIRANCPPDDTLVKCGPDCGEDCSGLSCYEQCVEECEVEVVSAEARNCGAEIKAAYECSVLIPSLCDSDDPQATVAFECTDERGQYFTCYYR